MTRKEFAKYFKHLLLLMLITMPVLVVLNVFCFKNLSRALVIFLDVVIGLVIILTMEYIIYVIKKRKENKKNGK